MSEFFGKGGGELWASIRDENVMWSKLFEDKIEKQLGNSCSIYSFRARGEDYPLCKAMVNHDHDRIKPRREWEVGDEVNRELFEGERNGGRDWTERGNSGMSVDLVLLANSTTRNEVFDKSGKTRPPEVVLNDRFSAEDPHVSREGGRVNRVEEG